MSNVVHLNRPGSTIGEVQLHFQLSRSCTINPFPQCHAIFLPGFRRNLGSNNFFTCRKIENTSSPYIDGIYFTLPSPSPCSPVIVPPFLITLEKTCEARRSINSTSDLESISIKGLVCKFPSPT